MPNAALLQARDVGPGYRATDVSGLDQMIGTSLSEACVGDWTSADDDRLGYGNQRTFRHPDQDGWIGQDVSRYRTPGRAADHLSDVSTAVDRCRQMPGAAIEHRFEVVDQTFTGDASLLIRHEMTGRQASHHLLVRLGAIVAELIVDDDLAENEIRTLADWTAARICHATRTC